MDNAGKMKLQDSYVGLEGLRFHAFHGVMAQERMVGNDYRVSLRLRVDVGKAVESDDVADTIDYSEVYRVVRREMERPSRLLEHVAGRIGEAVAARFPTVEAIDISITKTNPPMGADCDGASVRLHLINDKSKAG